MDIGERIKKYRNQRGFTQLQLAARAGMSRSYLADIELNRYNPSLGKLMNIANALGIPISCLLDDVKISFKNLLKSCEAKDLPLEGLGKFLGISAHDLECIRLNQFPSDDCMRKLCDYFDCSYDYLIGKTDNPYEIILGEKVISIDPSLDDDDSMFVAKVPILGTVAAGLPMYAEQNILGYEEIPRSLIKGGEYFFLMVKGDSMIGSRIYPGDKALIRKQPSVEDGQIALVSVNDEEATLKRIRFIDGTAILYPDNPAYKPMVYPINEVKILGYVVKVIFNPNTKKG